ncbi:DUF2846 domain-containing protein [Paraburkholderia humisilvae]|uniref:DUF2846 domain-containing protein n=1 Tax=Paraburkholderia humisilvae TaxID=627669 RepID=A0A6J5EYT5_9BURK|nr:DUF2846 domain-containing protein [Paraburkholderia humisilvae]CAB3770432.1 hypothetical protein LMG29542_06353 [Paraburkholderia humisilvae]
MRLPLLAVRHGSRDAPERALQTITSVVKTAFARVALTVAALCVAACAATPAEPVPFKAVPAERIVKPDYTEPGVGKVAVDVRRERTDNVIVRFRDALVYVDGERVADLMNGEHIVFYLSPGVHRLAVSTQFDPVHELQFLVTADPRYTNRASVTFNAERRIELRRVAQ